MLATTVNFSVLRWRIESDFCSEFYNTLQPWTVRQLSDVHHKSSFTIKCTFLGWQCCELASHVSIYMGKKNSLEVFAALPVLHGDHQVFVMEKASVSVSRRRKCYFYLSDRNYLSAGQRTLCWYSVFLPDLLVSCFTGDRQIVDTTKKLFFPLFVCWRAINGINSCVVCTDYTHS